MNRNIIVWGDSILRGVVYDEEEKRYVRLNDNSCIGMLSKDLHTDIKNRAIFGMTSTRALKPMHKAFETSSCQGDVAFIMFGGNDVDYKWSEVAQDPQGCHLPNTPLKDFISNLADMIDTARRHFVLPVLVNLPPLDASRYFNWFARDESSKKNVLAWLKDIQRIFFEHKAYNDAIENLSEELKCDLVDVRSPFLEQQDYGRCLCVDGIHPNQEGHRLIEGQLYSYAQEHLVTL